MASRVVCRQLGVVLYSGNYSLARSITIQQKTVVRRGGRLLCSRLQNVQQYCTAVTSQHTQSVEVQYENGLPVILVPLPSRREKCQFTLKPISSTLGDLMNFIHEEDQGVDRIAAYNTDGVRIAKSTPIDVLLQRDFNLVLNDEQFTVSPPQIGLPISSEDATNISDVKNTISQLFTSLNLEQHQLEREKQLLEKLENLKLEIQPLEKMKLELTEKAQKRTTVLQWFGLGLMGFQFGILARLTWWEYSWDIMEPVTYFVTYGTSMVMFAYYVCTKQEYIFPDVYNRETLLNIHKNAKKRKLDVAKYNKLCDAIAATEYDLARLRDPLQLQLPIQHILPKSAIKSQPQ